MPKAPEWRMPYGKHRGEPVSQVDEDYLVWLRDSSQATVDRVEHELARRRAVEEAEMPLAARLINAGYRELAKAAHPDAGGDPEQFRKITAARDALHEILKKVL